MRRIVVVGGSLAGHRATQALRDLGYDGELTVVGAEPHPPYDRYPLSKAFLAGRTDRRGLHLQGIPPATWRVGQTATALDLAGRQVLLEDGTGIPFDGLVIASGARPRDAASVACVSGAFVLRTVEDADGLRAALQKRTRRVVVVGGGLIGAEVAARAVAGGHDATLLDPSDVPTRAAVGQPIAEQLLRLRHLGNRARDRDRCELPSRARVEARCGVERRVCPHTVDYVHAQPRPLITTVGVQRLWFTAGCAAGRSVARTATLECASRARPCGHRHLPTDAPACDGCIRLVRAGSHRRWRKCCGQSSRRLVA